MTTYALIPLLPFTGFLIAGLFGKFLKEKAAYFPIAGVVGAFLLSVSAFVDVASGVKLNENLYSWISIGAFSVNVGFQIDQLTAVMLLVVTTLSSLIHIYSVGYMHGDKGYPRFFAYLALFTFFMLILVMANNFLLMFVGWEGVGLCSYLLIGFWYEKKSAADAGVKAFVVNRVGDFGFVLAVLLIFVTCGTLDFTEVFATFGTSVTAQTYELFGGEISAVTLIAPLLFLGATGKSAQLPLYVWLPDAMEGPTPVSALIHAATMVTAGVFMVARCAPIFSLSEVAMNTVAIVGALTAVFAATIGLVQNDIKRVIAYSTCSQLGYMFVAEGVGAYSIGVYHLFTHAFFKALLFLGAGSVIHAMHHEQDMRNMGGLRKDIPFTFAMMVIGTLALTGFPFTAGFYSKDAIIEAAYAASKHHHMAMFGFVATVAAAGLTSFYSWRLVFMTFFGARKEHAVHTDHADEEPTEASAHAHGDQAHHDHAHDHGHGHHAPHESPLVMLAPLAVLGLGALGAGIVFGKYFIGHDYDEFWKGALFTGRDNHIIHEFHDVALGVGLAPTVVMALGFAVALYVYVLKPGTAQALARAFPRLYQFLLNKWYFDELYDFLFVRPAFAIGRLFWKGGDGAIIDRLGPDGVAARVADGARLAVRLQTGYVYHYAFAMLIGVAAVVTYFVAGGLR